MSKINPFKPNSPAPTAMFAGRINEIMNLEKGLFQTKNNSNSNYLITGERGIGKSSLLLYLKYVSSNEIESLKYGKFDFIPINIVISDTMSLVTLIKLIERKVKREINKIEKVKAIFETTWDFIQRIRVMDSGISQSERDQELDIIIDEFAYSLSETTKSLTSLKKDENKKDGILFFLDEADNATEDLKLGYFIKTVNELLQQNECNNIMFVLAGLPNTVDVLTDSHPSSLRIFEHIKIKELKPEDRRYVVKKGIEAGNEQNEEKTDITESAINHISTLSEGYPHFIQQFAYSAFDTNTDGSISDEDVLSGAFKEGGAIDAIGSKYYENFFHDQIKSDEYRSVLSIMAEEMNSWIKKSEIRSKFSGTDTTLSNALQILTARKIILKNPSKIGEYRLQQRGFALWIKLFGDRNKV